MLSEHRLGSPGVCLGDPGHREECWGSASGLSHLQADQLSPDHHVLSAGAKSQSRGSGPVLLPQKQSRGTSAVLGPTALGANFREGSPFS